MFLSVRYFVWHNLTEFLLSRCSIHISHLTCWPTVIFYVFPHETGGVMRGGNCFEGGKHKQADRWGVLHVSMWNVIKLFVLLMSPWQGPEWRFIITQFTSLPEHYLAQVISNYWNLLNIITCRPKYKKFLIVAPTQPVNTQLWREYVARLRSFQQLFLTGGSLGSCVCDYYLIRWLELLTSPDWTLNTNKHWASGQGGTRLRY